MKKEIKKTDSKKTSENKPNLPAKDKAEQKDFPGYPHHPASEDIYNQEIETDLNPEDPTKKKVSVENMGKRNEKDFQEDLTGEDLDVPGSKADESENNAGSEDEENNYYSLGGDHHNDLEENRPIKPSQK